MNDRLHTARTSITALVLAMSMAMATVPATGLAAVDATTQTTATTSAAQGGGTDKATAKSRDVGKGTTDGQTGTGTDSETARGRGAGHKGRGADGTTKSNEEVVAGLTGLSDAEREELLALMNKRDALSEGQKLSDADRARMGELRQKTRHAKAQAAIEADTSLTDAQKSELKTKLDDLEDVEAQIEDYLSDPTYKKLEEQRSQAEEALGTYLGHGGHHRMK